MATSTRRTQALRLVAAAAFALAFSATLLLATPPTATAQADLALDGLSVADVEQTVDGNVTDVTVAADLDYSHDVPDASQRVVKLQVAPEGGTYETIDYLVTQDPTGNTTGEVALSGSVFDHGDLDAADVDPPLAGTAETTIEVRALVEVDRATGETVVANATDTATLTLTDGASLSAQIGGTGTLTVTTA